MPDTHVFHSIVVNTDELVKFEMCEELIITIQESFCICLMCAILHLDTAFPEKSVSCRGYNLVASSSFHPPAIAS